MRTNTMVSIVSVGEKVGLSLFGKQWEIHMDMHRCATTRVLLLIVGGFIVGQTYAMHFALMLIVP